MSKWILVNYRMTDIHAVIGLSQLSRLKKNISQRHEIAKIYDEEFLNSKVKTPLRNLDNKSVTPLRNPSNRNIKVSFTNYGKKIGVNLHYIPIHIHPYYQKLGFKWEIFPSEAYYRRAISLPIYPTLASKEQHFVIESVKSLSDE